jgi:hypothetical protein
MQIKGNTENKRLNVYTKGGGAIARRKNIKKLQMREGKDICTYMGSTKP